MALAFPVPLTQFIGRIPIETASLELGEAYEMNETGFGEILTAELGARLWQMKVNIRPGSYDEMEAVRSRLNMLRQPGRSFFVTPVPRDYPRFDPTGSILGATVPTLNSVSANMRDITLTGLPVGYRIFDGDYLSFQYGSNPVRYAFHQVLIQSPNGYTQANASGTTALFEITGNVRAGYALDTPVQLVKPYFKALIVPSSSNLGETGRWQTRGISFSVIQTLRN